MLFTIILSMTVLLGQGNIGQEQKADCNARRDVSRYEKAGPHDVDLWSEGKEELIVREWLWARWSTRRLGHMQETTHNKEGDRTEINYFIEPDADGTWHIHVTMVRHQVSRVDPFDRTIRIKNVEMEIYSIDRVKPRTSGRQPYVMVDAALDLPPDEYRLVFKDRKGKFLTEI